MNLVLGGTGALGRKVVEYLLRAGAPVRVVTRTPDRAADLAEAGAEVVRGDLLDRASIERACAGATAVVAAAHAMLGRGGGASKHVDGQGHRLLVNAARHAGADRFIYVSVYDFGPVWRAVPLFRIKWETEAYLQRSGLAWTVLRPTCFIETHAHQLIGQPILRKGRVALFGAGDRPRNFVAADDVARVVVRALQDPELIGKTVDVGGPSHHTSLDVVRLYERAAGRSAKVTHVPLAPLRVASALARPLHPGVSQILTAGVLAETEGQRYRGGSLEERFALESTPLEAWVSARVSGPTSPGGRGSGEPRASARARSG